MEEEFGTESLCENAVPTAHSGERNEIKALRELLSLTEATEINIGSSQC